MELLHCSVFLPIDKPGTSDSWFILQQIHRGMWVIKVSSCDHSLCWTEGYGPCGLQQPRDMPKPNCYPGLHRVIWIQDFIYIFKDLITIWAEWFEAISLNMLVWGGLMCSSSCSGSWGVVPAVAAAECHIAGSCAPVPPVPLKMDHDSQVVGAASYWTHSVPPHTVDGDVPQHPLISDHAPLSKSLLISSVPAASLWRCSLWEQHTYISASGKPRNICWSSWPLRETFSLDQQWKTLGFWYWSLLPSAIPNQKLSCILQCQSSPCTPSGRCCQCGFIPWPAGVKIQRKIPSLFLQNQ